MQIVANSQAFCEVLLLLFCLCNCPIIVHRCMQSTLKQLPSPTRPPPSPTRPPPSPTRPSALGEVYLVHSELMLTINEMDVKIEEVMRQHEAEFLLAYRNHIKTMKEELSAMKERAEEQERKMLSNDRAVFLEKQLILFREEALKLYDKLEEKTHQCEMHKTALREAQRTAAIFEKENKELLRTVKGLEAQLTISEGRNNELAQQAKEDKQLKQSLTRGQTLVSHPDHSTPAPKQSLTHQHLSIQSKQQSRPRGKTSVLTSITKTNIPIGDQQLKTWFLECLQTIRREVAQRKVYGYKSEDVRAIGSWEEFRMIDKLRLLEMFMQNEKLLVWMYERIFPTRMAEIEAYLANKPHPPREKSKSMHIHLDGLPIHLDGLPIQLDDLPMDPPEGLPRVISSAVKHKHPKYEVRNKIEIRKGKLNFSQLEPPAD